LPPRSTRKAGRWVSGG